MSEESFEEQQETLDPHRREERDGIALELVGRLRQKGVIITGHETSGVRGRARHEPSHSDHDDATQLR